MRYLLFAEFCFCFAPILLGWTVLIFSIPSEILNIVVGKNQNYLLLLSILLGFPGLFGLIYSVKVAIFKSKISVSFRRVVGLHLCGWIALIIMFGRTLITASSFQLVFLPIFCSSHFLYICYHHFRLEDFKRNI